MFKIISVVDASCANCQEKIDKLKTFDFIKPQKSLYSDFTLGMYAYVYWFKYLFYMHFNQFFYFSF